MSCLWTKLGTIIVLKEKMVTYVLSQHPRYWLTTRYAGEDMLSIGQAASEESAIEAVLQRAIKDRPSQIMRIDLGGSSRIVVKFARDQFDLEILERSGITVSPEILVALKDLLKS